MTQLRGGMPPLPKRFHKLPVDPRGYPVPWFVARVADGQWDFRIVRPGGIAMAVEHRTCWLCGEPLGRYMTFALAPVCAITRTAGEPPSHHDCAEFAAKACPFLTNPNMRRSPRAMPKGASDPAGIHLDTNPGVVCLWTTPSYDLFRAEGNAGTLITVGDPERVEWYARGAKATREEVEAAVAGDLPHLRAADPSPHEQAALDERLEHFRANYLPKTA